MGEEQPSGAGDIDGRSFLHELTVRAFGEPPADGLAGDIAGVANASGAGGGVVIIYVRCNDTSCRGVHPVMLSLESRDHLDAMRKALTESLRQLRPHLPHAGGSA